MPKFQKAVMITVLAVMFENSKEKKEEIKDFLNEAEIKVEKLDVNKNGKCTITFPVPEGSKEAPEPLELIPGYWLIKDEDGDLSVMDSEEFAATFQVAT